MRMWAFLAAALLTSLVLAGCSDDNDNGDGDSTSSTSSSPSSTSTSSSSTSSSSSTTSSSSTSTSTGPTGNRAPTGSISASVSNGSLPLSVNFTVDATDADGDHLAWDFDFGDGSRTNGTVVPTTVTHEYSTVGNYTALYVVSDGKLQSSYSVAINVTAGGGGGTTLFTHTEAATAPGNPLVSLEIPGLGWCGATCCAGFDAGMSGSDCVFFEIPATLEGHAFTTTSDIGDVDLEFWANCDPSELFSVDDFRNAGPEMGTVPAGAGCVVMWDNAAPPSAPTFPTFTFTV